MKSDVTLLKWLIIIILEGVANKFHLSVTSARTPFYQIYLQFIHTICFSVQTNMGYKSHSPLIHYNKYDSENHTSSITLIHICVAVEKDEYAPINVLCRILLQT